MFYFEFRLWDLRGVYYKFGSVQQQIEFENHKNLAEN